MLQKYHSIATALLLSPASSLIQPAIKLPQNSIINNYIGKEAYRATCGSRSCMRHYMSDAKTKIPSLDEDEGISRIFEDVDGIAGAGETYISLDDSFIPLDSETKEIVDMMAENIVTEISNAEPLSISNQIDEFVQDKISIQQETQITQRVSARPGIRKIVQFAVPAIGVWLCGPILSLIDTAAVGLLAGTKQQAGLNPAVAICDYSALLMAFLYTATTNLIATAREEEKKSITKEHTANTLISSMQLSGLVGLILGATLILTSKYGIFGIIGTDSVDPVVFSAARKYVNIRALGMPAAAIIGSAQAACLGMQDIRSPLYVLAAAAVVNFIGDAVFVGQKAAWLGGAAGAAWATVISQYTALFFFIKWLTSKSKMVEKEKVIPEVLNSGTSEDAAKRLKVTKNILRTASSSSAALDSKRKRIKNSLKKLHNSIQGNFDEELSHEARKKNPLGGIFSKMNKKPKKVQDDNFSVKGFLAGRFTASHLFRRADKTLARNFYPYVVPVTITSIGRVSAYIAMAHVVASSFGTLSMAAQQIITSFFYCLTPVADSLSLTAQSLVPRVSEMSNTVDGADDLWHTTVDFIKTGAIFGSIIAGIISCMPFLGGFFTSDARVLGLVNSVVPTLSAIFLAHGIMCATEGVLLGQKDLSFLGKTYGVYFFAIPYFMLRVKKAAIAGKAVSLTSLWQVFLGYNIFRTSAWILRSKVLAMNTKKLALQNSLNEI